MKMTAKQLKALGINFIANDKPDIVTDFSKLQAEVNRLSESNIKFAQENLKLRKEIETLEIRHTAVMLHTQSVVDENTALLEDRRRLDGLEAIPYQLEIVVKTSRPKTEGLPTLREQIDQFLSSGPA